MSPPGTKLADQDEQRRKTKSELASKTRVFVVAPSDRLSVA